MSNRLNSKWLRFVLLFGIVPAWLPSANANAVGGLVGQPAAWMPHDLIVGLNQLSKRYTCNDLWYRFRDVLLEIGARPDMEILPYRCERTLGEGARSPSVQLHFQLPEVLNGKLARWADTRVLKSTVTLEPGHPKSFDASDCDLLRQIKDTLFTRVGRAVSYHLACRAQAIPEPGYSLSVEVLKPVTDSKSLVASHADTPNSMVAINSSGTAVHD